MFCSRCGTEVQKATQFCPTCGLDLRMTSPVQAIATGDVSELDIVRDALAEEYELQEELGRGGMAIVYRARDKQLERQIAIKVLPFSLAFDADFVERFTREARTAAQLEHPNIISIYRVGKTGRVIYFVMKMLRGGSLTRVLVDKKRLQPAELRKLLNDVGSALGYAHKRGIVHRDIKPDNIMFDEFGQCVVTDFGIAKAGSGSKLTGTGMSIGTPHYMSPEQARAQPIDGRSDLYSLGILAYQALVGEVPYDGEDSYAIGYKHIMEPIPVPLLDTPEERRLFEVVKKLIMKDPLDRFQSAEDMLKVLEGQPVAQLTGAKRPSTAQVMLSVQSTTPLPAAGVMVPQAPSPRPSVAVNPADGMINTPDTPRRPVMRRSVAVQPPQAAENAVPWVLVAVVVLGLLVGVGYLYKKGLLGGHPSAADSTAVVTPPVVPDTLSSYAQDSLAAHDSTLLIPELSHFDSLGRSVDTARPRPTPVVPPPVSVQQSTTDSGFLRLENLPRGSTIYLDARPVTSSTAAGIRLPSGWHELGVSARGYTFYMDSVKVPANGTLVFTPAMEATSVAAPAPGSPAEMRRRVIARLDCETPSAVNKFGRLCYDTPPQPVGSTRVPVPGTIQGTPSAVVLIVKVSRQGRTLAVRTLTGSNEIGFTRAVESYADQMQWTPALFEGRPVDGWTQAAFTPDVP